MKKVLEILKDNSNINNIGLVNYAKTVTEIHEHYMKYSVWVYNNTNFIFDEIGIDNAYEYWLNLPENKKGE